VHVKAVNYSLQFLPTQTATFPISEALPARDELSLSQRPQARILFAWLVGQHVPLSMR
jgi:hypothetical protein